MTVSDTLGVRVLLEGANEFQHDLEHIGHGLDSLATKGTVMGAAFGFIALELAHMSTEAALGIGKLSQLMEGQFGAKVGEEMVAWIEAVARKGVYSTAVLSDTLEYLSAITGSAEVAKHQMSALMDVLTATGHPENMPAVFRFIEQLRGMPSGWSRSLRQLIGMGIPVGDILKQQFGLNDQGLKKLMGGVEGGRTGDQIVDAILKGIETNPKWRRIAELREQGFGAQAAGARVTFEQAWVSTGQVILEAALPLVKVLASVADWFRQINDATGGKAGLVMILGSAFVAVVSLNGALVALGISGGLAGVAMMGLSLILDAIAGVILFLLSPLGLLLAGLYVLYVIIRDIVDMVNGVDPTAQKSEEDPVKKAQADYQKQTAENTGRTADALQKLSNNSMKLITRRDVLAILAHDGAQRIRQVPA